MDSESTINKTHNSTEDGASTVTRRSFLKAAGFTIAVAAAGCERPPVQHALPHKRLSPEAMPGQASWYASTCGGCTAGCGVLAKNRDGRPIKLEGNPEHPVSRGGLCAVGQASVLDVYDSHRLDGPRIGNNSARWSTVDSEIRQALDATKKDGATVWLLTGTVHSPTERSAIDSLIKAYPNCRHASYDGLPVSAMLDVHNEAFGIRSLPHINFSRTRVIVSFDADFLGTWYSPVEHTQRYQEARAGSLKHGTMSYHAQFESRLSLTGSNADARYKSTPTEIIQCLSALHNNLRQKSGTGAGTAADVPARLRPVLTALTEKLWGARGASAVLCGMNDRLAQQYCAEINRVLDNYGSTMDMAAPSFQRLGSDSALSACLDDLRSGNVGMLIVHGVNPVYDLPGSSNMKEAIARVPMVVSFAPSTDETSVLAKYHCPVPHALEQWGDAEPVKGVFSIFQPAVQILRDTRPFAETLSVWSGQTHDMYDIVRGVWREQIYTAAATNETFELFWRRSVQQGFALATGTTAHPAWRGVSDENESQDEPSNGMALCVYPKIAMAAGEHAANAWLHEMPDPVTKIVWDNYACLAPADVDSMALSEGDVILISNKDVAFELPVHREEGQTPGTIAVATGYGRLGTGRFKDIGPQWLEGEPTTGPGGLVGVRVNDSISFLNGYRRFETTGWNIEPTGKSVELATSQKYSFITEPEIMGQHSNEPRECVKETTLAAFVANPASGTGKKHDYKSLWSGYDYNDHHWGMAIDLSACTGCSGCVVSCQAENNTPVVGKDEVRRHRFLHWLRIDRYYRKTKKGLKVSHQPMMCHQCDNAPCETVCPVLATAHSSEGLNQQVYNRCVGTRYCANNCPYKVRRFNWFNYNRNDEMANLVLNPDVTVRERGVMEKCTFCVQRIQEAKIRAKAEGRPLADGEAQPACAQSCPAKAIIFGDMNDPTSRIAKAMDDPRHYYALEEVGTRPSLGYLTLVRNTGTKEV